MRRATERLAASLDPAELNRVGFRFYERFRPELPAGAPGWGAKGVLDLAPIEGTASCACRNAAKRAYPPGHPTIG